jgi:hypothetical protein
MTKEPHSREDQEDVVPDSMPETPRPRPAQPGHDFTLQAVMEMQRTLGGVTEKIDALSGKLEKVADKLSDVEMAVHAVKIGAIVAGAILTIVGGVLWWAIGDRVTAAVHNALGAPPTVQTSPSPDPPPQPRKKG